MINHDHCSER